MENRFLKRHLLFPIILLVIVSCDKYELNDFESEYIDAYNVGDTILFKSILSNSIKRYLIIEKQNDLNYDLHNVYNAGNDRHSYVCYKDLGVDNGEIKYMVSIFNNKNEHHHIFLTFEDFGGDYAENFGTLNTKDTLQYFNNKFIDYYELNSIPDKRYPSTIKKIFWHKTKGIIKFDLKDGDSFVLVNKS